MKKRDLTPEERAECERLREIFDRKQRAPDGRKQFTQQDAADALGISQGAIGHYLGGRNALNLTVALKFSKFLGCEVMDFSSRLAVELADMAGTSGGADAESKDVQAPSEDPPLIQWSDIPDRLAGAAFPSAKRCKVNTSAYGPRTFWVPVKDNAMVGGMVFIPVGHRIAVDPDADWRTRLRDGKRTFALAQVQVGEEPVFRELTRQGGQLLLVAADSRYPLLGPIRDEDVIGMVLEAVMEL